MITKESQIQPEYFSQKRSLKTSQQNRTGQNSAQDSREKTRNIILFITRKSIPTQTIAISESIIKWNINTDKSRRKDNQTHTKMNLSKTPQPTPHSWGYSDEKRTRQQWLFQWEPRARLNKLFVIFGKGKARFRWTRARENGVTWFLG